MEKEMNIETIPSGIYKAHNSETVNDGIVIKFGGAIDISAHAKSLEDKSIGIINMEQLKTPLNVGDPIPETNEYIGPFVQLIFNNTKSIDILIDQLNWLKNKLNNK